MNTQEPAALHIYSIEAAGESHVGCARQENQDAFLVDAPSGMFAVADGVGGLAEGRLASDTLVGALGSIRSGGTLADAIGAVEARAGEANRALLRVAAERNVSLGTTLVALAVRGGEYACIWAGDSRLYLVRGGSIHCVSEDHNEANELVRQGVLHADEAWTWPRRNVITRAIGVTEPVELDIARGRIEDGDVFLLCSDGLTTHLADDDILREIAGRAPEVAAAALIRATLERGARDNVTVVLARFRRRPGGAGGARGRGHDRIAEDGA